MCQKLSTPRAEYDKEANMTDSATETAVAAPAHHADEPHLVPIWVFVGTWLALVILTGVTVVVAGFDLGEINFHVAMAVASVKAAFVLLFFMHLLWDKPINAAVFIISIAFVALLIAFTMTDARECREEKIPGYAPAIQQP